MEESSGQRSAKWTARVDDDETRAYYQERLRLFAKMMFIIDGMFFAIAVIAYRLYPSMRPERMLTLHVIGASGLLLLVGMWRVLLKKDPRSLRQLLFLDTALVVGIGVIFGVLCFFSYDHEVNMWSMFIWTVFMVFGRVLYVPSTARRTAVLSSVAVGCIALAGSLVALWRPDHLSVPGPVWAIGSTLYGAVAVLIAAVGSNVMYGLRSQVRAAQKLGQYTLGRKIGEGGMGAVYEAHHSMLRRPTAIKLLPPKNAGAESMIRFEREVQITAGLNHPNTVAIYDYGRSREGLFYYAMEFLDGLDLESLVRTHGPQRPARVVHILLQASGALEEAHRNGLIHRDIKPANILLCELGGVPDVAKVVDFGLVKELKDNSQMTTASMVAGTPAYISPEAVMDPDKVGAASDLYGLGGVGYFMLTGHTLFEAGSSMEMCVHHARTEPVPVAERAEQFVSAELSEILMSCVAKLPADRPSSAAHLRKLLMGLPESREWQEDEALTWWRDTSTGAEDRAQARGKDGEAVLGTQSLTVKRWELGIADTIDDEES